MKNETRSYSSEDVVFTGIREDGRSFGQHLEFFVYTLKADSLPRRVGVSSFAHSVANSIFEKTRIPTGAYVESYPRLGIKKTPFIIATAPLSIPNGEIEKRVVDQIVSVGIYETGQRTTLVNLYMRGQKFAIQTLWSRILQQAMKETHGFSYEYDVVHHGIMVKIDGELLEKYLPNWADDLTARNALDVSSVNKDAIQKLRLKNCDFSLFEPQRYVDLDPRVGSDGTAYALTPVRTRMECPSKLNLSFLSSGLSDALREWQRSYNRTKVFFRMEWQGRRLKPNAVHLETIIPKASEQDIEHAKNFLSDQGFKITPRIEQLIQESRVEGLAVVRPHYLSEDYRRGVTFVVPLRMLIPVITQENMRLFSKLVSVEAGTKRLSKIYWSLTRFDSDATACVNHAVANALTNELHPIIRWEKGEKTVNFIPGPMSFKAGLRKRRVFRGFDAFRLNLPNVAVLNRETGMLQWIDPQDLYYYAIGKKKFEEPLQILSRPEKFEDRVRVALIHPEYRSNYRIKRKLATSRGPNICKSIMLGDFDYLDPDGTRRRSKKSPIKFIEQRMAQMYSFFGYDPSKIEVVDYMVEDLTIDEEGMPCGYLDEMKKALRHGADLFIVFLPSSPSKWLRDRVYYGTYAFGFEHGKPVMHYRPKTWKGFTELYGLAYSHLANMARRFGGAIFKVDTQNLWGRIAVSDGAYSIKNPICIYVDFGPWYGHSVGLITSTRADFSRSHCHITLQAEEGKLFERIDTALKGLIKKGGHDFLLTMRDGFFRETELKRIVDVADDIGIPTLPISTIKSGGLSAWKFRKRYVKRGLTVTAPYGIGLSTPEDAVELFPHNIALERMQSGGLWRSIRLKKETPYPATIRIDKGWIANLGMILASTAGYLPFPTRMKYPEFLRKADLLAELVQNGVFPATTTPIDSRMGILKQFDASLID